MDDVALYLTNIFVRKKIFDEEKRDIYVRGFGLLIADIINFGLILLFGIITKSLIYSILYILMLVTVRRFCGGFHAKTYCLCRIVTVGTYIGVFLLNKLITDNRLLLTVLFDIIAFVSMLVISPVKTPNKKMTIPEIKINKLLSLVSTLLYSLVSLALVMHGNEAGVVISLNLLAITVLMYTGLAANKRREGKI